VPTSSGGHRPKLLLPHHRTSVNGIPCTTLPPTLVDLGSVVPPARLERIVDRVVTQSPAMLPALHTTFDELAKRGRPGIAAMRGLLRSGRSEPLSGRPAWSNASRRSSGTRASNPSAVRSMSVATPGWVVSTTSTTRSAFSSKSTASSTTRASATSEETRRETTLCAPPASARCYASPTPWCGSARGRSSKRCAMYAGVFDSSPPKRTGREIERFPRQIHAQLGGRRGDARSSSRVGRGRRGGAASPCRRRRRARRRRRGGAARAPRCRPA
jgi:hypothetical protein